MCQILHKKVDGGGCKQYRNRQAKCVAFKKDDLKFRNIAFYKNVYEHFFKHGDPFYIKKQWEISTFYGAHRKS